MAGLAFALSASSAWRAGLMRPVRAAGSRWGGFPKTSIRQATAPAQDHGSRPASAGREQRPVRQRAATPVPGHDRQNGCAGVDLNLRPLATRRTRRPPRSASAGAAPVARSPPLPASRTAAPANPTGRNQRGMAMLTAPAAVRHGVPRGRGARRGRRG